MLVIDESTGKKVKKEKCTEVVVSCKNGKLILGYVEDLSKCVLSRYFGKDGRSDFYNALYEKTKNDMFFSNHQGNVSPSIRYLFLLINYFHLFKTNFLRNSSS